MRFDFWFQEKLSMRSKQKKLFEFWPLCLQPCKLFAIKINPANRFNNMSWNSIGHYQRSLHILGKQELLDYYAQGNGRKVKIQAFNTNWKLSDTKQTIGKIDHYFLSV
ncbi:unnamed protein product [Malus baccata var. baccata]